MFNICYATELLFKPLEPEHEWSSQNEEASQKLELTKKAVAEL